MAENKYKEYTMAKPVENHTTAAWANIESVKPVSNVTIPSDFDVIEAKEWVDANQK